MDKIPEEVRDYLMGAYELAGQWSLPNNRGNHELSEPLELKTVAIIGGGTMGRGIAISFSLADFKTFLVVRSDEAAQRCEKELETLYTREKSFKRLNDKKIEKIRANLEIVTDFEKLKDCDLVIESVYEEMKVKQELFLKLEKYCKKDCIFGTNSSSLDLNQMAKVLQNPSKVVGIHFFNPANMIKLVEVIYGKETSGEAVATAFEACRAIKKLAILVGNCPAFVFNRLLYVYFNQAQKLLYQYGYQPAQVDRLVTGAGFLMGPLTVADMNGLDVNEKLKTGQAWDINPFEKVMWQRKWYGRKTNKGFYNYDAKTQKKSNSVEMEQLIKEFSSNAQPKIKISNDEDALNFLLYPMVNEGFRCIEEGMIAQENLVDIMFILGFGWPIATGGPMRFGRAQGIEKVASAMVFWNSMEPHDNAYQLADTLKVLGVKKSKL